MRPHLHVEAHRFLSPRRRLRREIEPVSGAVFMRFLFDWQHLTVTTRLQSSDGLMALLEQMSGFEYIILF